MPTLFSSDTPQAPRAGSSPVRGGATRIILPNGRIVYRPDALHPARASRSRGTGFGYYGTPLLGYSPRLRFAPRLRRRLPWWIPHLFTCAALVLLARPLIDGLAMPAGRAFLAWFFGGLA